jgi:hypothetical protein
MGSKRRKQERAEIARRHPEQFERFRLPHVNCLRCEHLETEDKGESIFWKRDWRCAALGMVLHVQTPGQTLPSFIDAPKECPKRERKKDDVPLPLP